MKKDTFESGAVKKRFSFVSVLGRTVLILILVISNLYIFAPHTHAADVTCSDVSNANVVSSNGLIKWLCSQTSTNPNGNIISVLLETAANWLVGMLTIFFGVVIMTSVVGLGFAGASPGGIQSAKKRITNAVVSIVLFWTARIIFDLTGITSGSFLGVNVASGFNTDTPVLILGALVKYLTYIGGAISVISIIVAGIRFMTSQGAPNAINQARKMIAYSVITLVVIGSFNLVYNLIGLFIKG